MFKGKLLSNIISSDLIDFFFFVESDDKGLRSNFKRGEGQRDRAKMARTRVCNISGATNHARSRERLKMFMISRNHCIGDRPY